MFAIHNHDKMFWHLKNMGKGLMGGTAHFENFELNHHFGSFLHRVAHLFSEIFCESSVTELSEPFAERPPTQRCELIFEHFYQSAVTPLLFDIFWAKVLK